MSQITLKEFRTPLKDSKFLVSLKNTSSNDVLFLQETHSSSTDKIKWKDELKEEFFFSHGKTNSCGIVIGYTGKRSCKLLQKENDENGRFLKLKAIIDDFIIDDCFHFD